MATHGAWFGAKRFRTVGAVKDTRVNRDKAQAGILKTGAWGRAASLHRLEMLAQQYAQDSKAQFSLVDGQRLLAV